MEKSRYDIGANHIMALRNIIDFKNGFDTVMRSPYLMFDSMNVSVMVREGYLWIFPNVLDEDNVRNKIPYLKVSIDSIECYGIEGDIHYGQRMIGDGVKSVTFDSRVTYINYFEDGIRKKMTFLMDLYQYLFDMIPEKMDDIVYSKIKAKLVNAEVRNKKEKILELKEMLSEGCISEEDYLIAKKDILGK